MLFVVLAALAACGGSGAAPKAADDLSVGKADAGSALAVAPSAPEEASSDAEAAVPIGPDDPIRGDKRALVTLVVWSDFQCPYCGKLATGPLERLREEYSNDDLRIVFKNQPLPFHPHAKLAAEVGQGVFATRGADAFWRFHDMAFRRQQMISPDAIKQWAIGAGADGNEIDAGLEAHRWTAKIDADRDLGSKLGANGTPTSFINGVTLVGAQPYEKFKAAVDAERDKAKALAERGTPRGKIYASAVAANFQAPKPPEEEEEEKEDTQTVWRVPVGGSPVRGKATALVTVIEFSDFQCPFCKRVQPTLEQIRKDYGDKVRIVWKDEPLSFHPRARPAANLARFARSVKGDAGFWDVHDRLFDKQPQLEDIDLESVARAAGLDASRAMSAVASKQFDRQIEGDVDLADELKASGTPHFFVNGRRLVGAQPYDKFKTILDEEVKKSEALLKSGVAATALYETLQRSAKGPADPETKIIAQSPTAAFKGPANAPVVIQEFGDFECPFCEKVEATLDDLMKANPGKIKLVWRDNPLPFHPHAAIAAEAAREAYAQKGNDGFSKMRALLFKNRSHLERADLATYAAQIGLDGKRFEKSLDAHTHKAAIDADAKVAADNGISGTPSFVVGPYFLAGAQPLTRFQSLVDRAQTAPPPPTKPTTTLQIADLAPGTGAAAKSGDTLTVHYVGKLTDGTVFDSSRTHNQPFTFELGKGLVIKGWDQGLVGMKVGGKRKLTIPPDLAYGDRGVSGKIPAKSTLVFEVELLSIK
ncbi:MAG TPA: thioredoxin domain-containing protein [Labilithrix sp.]